MRKICVILCTIIALVACHTDVAYSDITCDGIDDVLTMSNIALGSTYTIVMWFTPLTSTAHQYGTIENNNNGTLGTWYKTDVTKMTTCVSAYCIDPGVINVPMSLPHVIAVVSILNTSITMYVDGVVDTTHAITTDTMDLNKVCGDTNSQYLNAKLSQISIYTQALSANEIASLSLAKMKGVALTRTLTAQWTFDHCPVGGSADGVAFVDRSGNGHTLTASDGANNTGMSCDGSKTLSYQ